MAIARIINDTGRDGPWAPAIREVLVTAGFGIGESGDETAGLTVLVLPADKIGGEAGYKGDLLVLSVSDGHTREAAEPVPTEVIGSGRLKVRHRLQDPDIPSATVDELRPLVKLFLQ